MRNFTNKEQEEQISKLENELKIKQLQDRIKSIKYSKVSNYGIFILTLVVSCIIILVGYKYIQTMSLEGLVNIFSENQKLEEIVGLYHSSRAETLDRYISAIAIILTILTIIIPVVVWVAQQNINEKIKEAREYLSEIQEEAKRIKKLQDEAGNIIRDLKVEARDAKDVLDKVEHISEKQAEDLKQVEAEAKKAAIEVKIAASEAKRAATEVKQVAENVNEDVNK